MGRELLRIRATYADWMYFLVKKFKNVAETTKPTEQNENMTSFFCMYHCVSVLPI